MIRFSSFVASVLALSLLSSSAFAGDALEARVEANWALGSERSILMTEFWVPLAQDDRGVLYGDYRMMGDDQDNREFNVGLGYREIVDVPVLGEGVAGIHGWFDRRHTERGSTFNQVTLGTEWYGEDVDLKLNGYFPLNDSKSHTQANQNASGGRFVSNQIVVDTDQSVREEALKGFDLELGLNIPFLKEHTDSTRVYGGVYHFAGDRAESVSGWRTRIAADVTSDFEIGARFQRDDVRGSQGFLEATIRFPFGRKKSYRKEGLRARLDESPERDIDIVSNEVITDNGRNRTLLNAATGGSQNVIHVNNTAAGGGDGSAETPYNNLAAAVAIAGEDDLIYVHRGDGTATGQNAGISINDDGQMLVGSGSPLIFDGKRFTTSNGQNTSSNVIVPADPLGAPIVTNGVFNGISIGANNVHVSGLTVDGSSRYGVEVYTTTTLEGIRISDLTLTNNASGGIVVQNIGVGGNSSSIRDVSIDNVTANGNTGEGIRFSAQSNAQIADITVSNSTVMNNSRDGLEFTGNAATALVENITARNVTANNNRHNGIVARVQNGGQMRGVSITGSTTHTNDSRGVFIETAGAGSRITDAVIRGGSSVGNQVDGIRAFAHNNAYLTSLDIIDVTSNNNQNRGVWVWANDGGEISSVNLRNVTANNNQVDGVLIQSRDGVRASKISSAMLDNITAMGNQQHGIWIYATGNDADIDGVIIQNSVTSGNTQNGVNIDDSTAIGNFVADLGGGVLGNTGHNSFYGNTGADIQVDLDGGVLKAENNWWGANTGLDAGRLILDSGSGIDATPFLTGDPNN